jgi:hypothetical protein
MSHEYKQLLRRNVSAHPLRGIRRIQIHLKKFNVQEINVLQMSDKANKPSANEPMSKRTKLSDADKPLADDRPAPSSVVAKDDKLSNVSVVARHYNAVAQV